MATGRGGGLLAGDGKLTGLDGDTGSTGWLNSTRFSTDHRCLLELNQELQESIDPIMMVPAEEFAIDDRDFAPASASRVATNGPDRPLPMTIASHFVVIEFPKWLAIFEDGLSASPQYFRDTLPVVTAFGARWFYESRDGTSHRTSEGEYVSHGIRRIDHPA